MRKSMLFIWQLLFFLNVGKNLKEYFVRQAKITLKKQKGISPGLLFFKNSYMKTTPKNSDLSFLPLHLVELNKPRQIKSLIQIRKSPGIFSRTIANIKRAIKGFFALAILIFDSLFWFVTGLSPWFILPFLAFLIIFGPALAVQWFSL